MERKAYFKKLDIIKGLAMFLVVLGHCIQCGSGNKFYQSQLFFDDFIYRIIYSFHMPLFMMISGFLYGRTLSGKSFLRTLKNRSLRLLLPIVAWTTIVTLLSFIRGGGIDIGEYLYSVLTGFWFLWAVWWATTICSFIEMIGKTSRLQIILHMMVIIITFFTPDGLNFFMYKFMYVAFLIGYAAEKCNLDTKFEMVHSQRYLYLMGLAALYIILFSFFRKESYIYISGWTLLGKDNWFTILVWDVYRTLIGAVGGILFIYLIYLFVPEKSGCLLGDVGKNSSGVYILQTYANIVMLKVLAGVEHYIWLNIIEAVVVCTGCYAAVKIISLIPWASLVLFGQKRKA